MERVFFPLFSILFSILPPVSSTLSFIDSLNPRVLPSVRWQPIPCSHPSLVPACNSYLYVKPHGLSAPEIAAIYSASASLIEAVNRSASASVDFLVQVPCMCAAANESTTIFFFHDTDYTVKLNDAPDNLKGTVFSGLAWDVGGTTSLKAGENITVQLVCGNSALGPWAGNLVCCSGGGHPWHNSQYFEFQCGADSEYEPKFNHQPRIPEPWDSFVRAYRSRCGFTTSFFNKREN